MKSGTLKIRKSGKVATLDYLGLTDAGFPSRIIKNPEIISPDLYRENTEGIDSSCFYEI